jgi:hypothetical protein
MDGGHVRSRVPAIAAVGALLIVTALLGGCGDYRPRLGAPTALSDSYSATAITQPGRSVELTPGLSPEQAAGALKTYFLSDSAAAIDRSVGTPVELALPLKGSPELARGTWNVIAVMPVVLPTTTWGQSVSWQSLKMSGPWVCVLSGPHREFASFSFMRQGDPRVWRYGTWQPVQRDPWNAIRDTLSTRGAHSASYKYVPFTSRHWGWVAIRPEVGGDFAQFGMWVDSAVGIDNQQANALLAYPLDAIGRVN